MKESLREVLNVISQSEICNVSLTCDRCDTITKKQVDKSIIDEMEVILIEGECSKCGNTFVNRFEMDEIECRGRSKKTKNTLLQLLKGLDEMGVDTEMYCIKTKSIKK